MTTSPGYDALKQMQAWLEAGTIDTEGDPDLLALLEKWEAEGIPEDERARRVIEIAKGDP